MQIVQVTVDLHVTMMVFVNLKMGRTQQTVPMIVLQLFAIKMGYVSPKMVKIQITVLMIVDVIMMAPVKQNEGKILLIVKMIVKPRPVIMMVYVNPRMERIQQTAPTTVIHLHPHLSVITMVYVILGNTGHPVVIVPHAHFLHQNMTMSQMPVVF
jgi:hypothetical protein